MNLSQVTINEVEFDSPHEEKGKITILQYNGIEDPVFALDDAVKTYVGEKRYYEFVDLKTDNLRVVITNINNIPVRDFNPDTDKLVN